MRNLIVPSPLDRMLRRLLAVACLILLLLSAWATPGLAFPDLGRYWEENPPGGWRGTWVRRGNSNAFDARWSHPRYGQAAAYIIVNYTTTNRVTIVRTDTIGYTRGKRCRYEATISADGRTVSGSGSCDWAPGPIALRATIRGQTYREYRYPRHPRRPDYPLDFRMTQDTRRGYPAMDAANVFCRDMGFRRGAKWWDLDNVARGRNYRTAYIGNNQVCSKACMGFRAIHCRY